MQVPGIKVQQWYRANTFSETQDSTTYVMALLVRFWGFLGNTGGGSRYFCRASLECKYLVSKYNSGMELLLSVKLKTAPPRSADGFGLVVGE